MSTFIYVLILCLLTGVIFAALAVYLTKSRGNTISDVLNSPKFENAEAIKVAITDKIKLSSNVPVVALYVIAAAVAIGLPSFLAYLWDKDAMTIKLIGTVIKDPEKEASMTPVEMDIQKSGTFALPVLRKQGSTLISIRSNDYAPVTLAFDIDTLAQTLKVSSSNLEISEQVVDIDPKNWEAHLHAPIKLLPAKIPIPNENPGGPAAIKARGER